MEGSRFHMPHYLHKVKYPLYSVTCYAQQYKSDLMTPSLVHVPNIMLGVVRMLLTPSLKHTVY